MDIFHPPLPTSTESALSWSLLPGAGLGLALSQAAKDDTNPLVVITEDSLAASHLFEALQFFGMQADQLLLFPDWETLPYDHFSPHQDIISERLAVLSRIPTLNQGIVITTIDTLMHALPPSAFIDGHRFVLKTKDKLNIDVLRTKLTHAGYRNVSQVQEHGEFAIRGSIIDLYPMGSDLPFRLDLFDDEIDSIRTFAPETQRTIETITEIHLLPAKEFPMTEESIEQFRQAWRNHFQGNPLKCPIYQDISEGIAAPGIEYYLPLFFPQTATLFDFLPPNATLVTAGEILHKAEEFWREIEHRYNQGRYDITRPLLDPSKVFIEPKKISEHLQLYPRIYVTVTGKESFKISSAPTFDINHKATEPLAPLREWLDSYKGRVLFCAESTGRREVLLQLFRTISLAPTLFQSWNEFLTSDKTLGMVVTPLEEGFQLTDPVLILITESHLYGKRVMQRRLRKKTAQDPDAIIRNLTELQIGDPVVHIDHGIGRYLGLQTLTIGEQVGEFFCLEYQGGDKLYVPVSSLDLISRYSGADPEHTPINKLGTEQWQRAKRRAAEKVRDVAAELLDLYAKRAAKPGHSYDLAKEQYNTFAAGFPFEETPDQLQAIESVFNDLVTDKPMDRVVCGDVGFGKTEVAMRAAFIAVQNGKQVAVLVPTTLLAQQHWQNFQDRFADWPIKVDMLSRFRTGKEQKTVLDRLADGHVDIVIGTHKLLQGDIKFKNLGLVIIDEEHRFGVKQKEMFKSLRAQVDMLTLTATPIPRTMNMALSGIRDLSIIATPPARRLSVKTFVYEYNNGIIQEAIQREIMRGGQVYFLHNDVSTIQKKADELAELVKEARITVAHGQMHERELEKVMTEFYHRHFNVLVCSTIIESGIDIPTANTIVINRADKFGIAQLHQLRGRVGRSHHQAYAYLLIPPKKTITSDAAKRLQAITAYDDLGIGFTLATHDLEIRGAGELLGEQQSGDMHEVGFTLYMELLTRAVDALKQGKEPDNDINLLTQRSEVDLHLTALIPDTYLADVNMRLQFYKRIANAKNSSELDEIQVEMIDRFGLLPEQLKNLIAISELKLKANELGIVKVDATDKGGKFEFNNKPNINPETIIKLIQNKPQQYRLDGPSRLRFTLPKHATNERITLVAEVLNALQS